MNDFTRQEIYKYITKQACRDKTHGLVFFNNTIVYMYMSGWLETSIFFVCFKFHSSIYFDRPI